jgi:G3E family GTPase
MSDYAALIPVNVLSGFLGSGKTTLLKRLLESPQLPDTAVLINEFGEVGLDHQLVQHVTETTLLLDNGCVCCAIRGDLQKSLRDLFSQRERGQIPKFRRIVIEASGLADPAPIAYTVMAEPVLQHHFRLGNIVTVVDAVNGLQQLQEFPESVKQAALADRLLISKTDLCEPTEVERLRVRLTQLNAAAPIITTMDESADARHLLLDDVYDADARAREADHWLKAEHDAVAHDHTEGVTSFCMRFEQPLDWTAFGIWMTMLLNRYGDKVLRIKGMLNVAGLPAPVLINGVQHIVHPPTHLAVWPDQDRRSRIVFIVRDMQREPIEASLKVFNALAN